LGDALWQVYCYLSVPWADSFPVNSNSKNIPPMLLEKLHQVFGILSFADLRQCYLVLSTSIMEIFRPDFTIKSKDSSQFAMDEILRVSTLILVSLG
jgi:hypothetical protein